MKPEDYKKAAIRTENTPNFILKHRATKDGRQVDMHNDLRHEADLRLSRIMHAILGMITELGELCDPVKRHLIYDAPLNPNSDDKGGLREEMGDRAWYDALFLDAIDAQLEDIWERNIAKLRARFPDKFTSENALKRDLVAEHAALTSGRNENAANKVVSDMMAEICALHPATNTNDARAIFEWRRVFMEQHTTSFHHEHHVMAAMTDIAHALGVDAPRELMSSTNKRLSAMCRDEIDRLKRERFVLQALVDKMRATMAMG